MTEFISGLNPLLALFLIAALGYLIGAIKIKGIELGTAGVLLVALVFGHFGCEMPSLIRNVGLALFVTSVGFIAGPKFFRNFKQNAKSYILLGFIIILTGALTCALLIAVSGVGPELMVGLMTGALTSTPGLAAAQGAAGDLAAQAAIGYAIAYPFGVVGVVLFPLGGGDNPPVFALGTTGGPLLVGLIFGHFGHVGPIDLTLEKPTLVTFRELGLMLFLIGAGTEGGAGFVDTLRQEGAILFVYGAAMTILPMIVGYFVAAKTLKLSLLNNLGSITGGMTSTPALGTLIAVAGTDDVASAYAATYPIALVSVVLASQFLVVLFR